MKSSVYNIYFKTADDEPQVICICDSIEDARESLIYLMKSMDRSDDEGYCGDEEDRQNHIDLLNEIAETDGVDVTDLINKIRNWSLPCVFNHENYEDICNVERDSFCYDSCVFKIVEEITEVDDKIVAKVKDHLKRACDEPVEISVNSFIAVKDAYFIEFTYNGSTSKAIYYKADDILFTPYDWQGSYPENINEIEYFDWISSVGDRTIIVDGLPRLLGLG